ncbi:MAG TPA: hypothetical protein VEZ40_05720 [Pyrinomonadaceae bacterium]|nr:hypothetical protein [Pyrinomonadaceae bacterium]
MFGTTLTLIATKSCALLEKATKRPFELTLALSESELPPVLPAAFILTNVSRWAAAGETISRRPSIKPPATKFLRPESLPALFLPAGATHGRARWRDGVEMC